MKESPKLRYFLIAIVFSVTAVVLSYDYVASSENIPTFVIIISAGILLMLLVTIPTIMQKKYR